MPSTALKPYPWQRVPRLAQRIRFGHAERAHAELDVLLDEFRQEHGNALAPLRLRCGMVLSYCLRGARLGGAPSELIMEQLMAAVDHLAKTRSRKSIHELMHRFLDQMLGHITQTEQTRLARVIRNIVRDLNHDPGKARALQAYAGEVNMHPDYLSRQFRLVTGQTFCEARRAARMKRARHLLLASPMKVREVARRVGVNDESQFIRTFREEFGMTAHQYRLQHARA